MFNATDKPRIFGMPLGADFASSLVTGLQEKATDLAPTDWARVEIFVNTSRMRRRIRDMFDGGPARLLPRIRLITDLANDPLADVGPPAVSPLRRRLELSQFVSALLTQDPTLAPRAALYDLSDSLAKLMEEMHGEGVDPSKFADLDVSDESGHWDRALKFLNIVAPFFEHNVAPDKDLRLRRVVTQLAARWTDSPPTHPIIVAGSTGSRGATALFMKAVASLPQGAVILPGFDFDLPHDVWDQMTEDLVSEDHPQYRFRKLMDLIGFGRHDVTAWDLTPPPHPARNSLISLSLRPAPVTDQWLRDGPTMGDLIAATQGITLIEAPSPRAEAETIALRLRAAAQDGITAALITPDRMLTRQVTAALERWDIRPDDSAGTPLPLSPPGRMLRHIADLFGKPVTGESLLTLLKHPLCNTGGNDRNTHLLNARELELELRRNGPPFPTALTLQKWSHDTARADWAAWLGQLITDIDTPITRDLSDHITAHITLAEQFCAGPNTSGAGGLWDEAAGREARRICDNLTAQADAGGELDTREYAAMFGAILNEGTVRNPDGAQPNILIWGTLEARVQGADLVILGGMNEGICPEAATPDPWLNRKMRKQAGLLLPERRIGLSAHDYQQAVAGKEVWISRAKRSAEAETVPSRWVNRLVNLLGGLPNQSGQIALDRMRADGNTWLAKAASLSTPQHTVAPAKRPSPQPPIAARPKRISVTQVKTLIRDPYAIYAQKVLRLNELNPLIPTVDFRLRGIIVHEILEKFIASGTKAVDTNAREILMQIAREIFTRDCPWPTIRAQWLSRIDRIADTYLKGEVDRQSLANFSVLEAEGDIMVGDTGVKLTCKADRIDLTDADTALIYDYKTGQIPTTKMQERFDKQLLLEAAMVERGAFEKLGKHQVDAATFVAMNTTMKDVAAPLEENPSNQVWADFVKLLNEYNVKSRGYSARIATFSRADTSYFDHLSRFGEWDTSQDAVPEDLT
ncbi:double-strand break repair protein AddB [Yoonia sp. MH D7]